MTIIEPQGAPILVTGANGYIGLWIVRTLLEKGYSVRAVVRSSDKGHHLEKIFGIYRHKLEIYVVEDIQKASNPHETFGLRHH